MDRRIFFCGGAAVVCLILAELAADEFRGVALLFAGVYVFYTLLFGLDELARRRRSANPARRPPSSPPGPEPGTTDPR